MSRRGTQETPAGGDLAAVVNTKLQLAAERMDRGPPAFERFPRQALRYREWGKETRHADWSDGGAVPYCTAIKGAGPALRRPQARPG